MDVRLETLAGGVPYLRASPALDAQWGERLGTDGGLRVGLAWAGLPTHGNDRNRSIPPAMLAPLGQTAGVSFFSLQKGPPAETQPPSGLTLTDLGPELSDFADTAACIANLDLVITVDTSIAHLAGAMGKPVWVMLPFAPDWRWMLGRDDSPWYPSARLFRQPAPGEWEPVVVQIAAALSADIANRG